MPFCSVIADINVYTDFMKTVAVIMSKKNRIVTQNHRQLQENQTALF